MSDDDVFRASVRERSELAAKRLRDAERESISANVNLLLVETLIYGAKNEIDVSGQLEGISMVVSLLAGQKVHGVKL